jgi:hypothetical protein
LVTASPLLARQLLPLRSATAPGMASMICSFGDLNIRIQQRRIGIKDDHSQITLQL